MGFYKSFYAGNYFTGLGKNVKRRSLKLSVRTRPIVSKQSLSSVRRAVVPSRSGVSNFQFRSKPSRNRPYLNRAEDWLKSHPGVGEKVVKYTDWVWNHGLRDVVSKPLKMIRSGQLHDSKYHRSGSKYSSLSW